LLKRYYDEFIRLENDFIVYRSSRINGERETIIPTTNLKVILWENESFAGLGSRNSIYLIDKTPKKHVLVENKIAGFFSINKTTVAKLSGSVSLPVKKEFYFLSSDQKQRQKVENSK
jgi:hypothetical protein